MLGRKDYTRAELEHGRSVIEGQLAAYEKFVEAISQETADDAFQSARADFEAPFFTTSTWFSIASSCIASGMVDRQGRQPPERGRDALRLLDERRRHPASREPIRYPPAESVLGLDLGDQIRMSDDEFERLASAFFTELVQKFVEA